MMALSPSLIAQPGSQGAGRWTDFTLSKSAEKRARTD
jgi:hypothetical protein